MSDAAESSRMAQRPLFGGAIILELPTDLIDVSELRQIPDNQEVFLALAAETSVVIEILGMVEEGEAATNLWEAAKFHFNSLAHDNSSLSSTIITSTPTSAIPFSPIRTTPPSGTPTPIILEGTQCIHKFSHDPTGAPRPGHEDDTPDTVWIGLALWRCWYNAETAINGVGGSERLQKKADLVMSVNVNLSSPEGKREQEKVKSWFERSVGSLSIVDWNLFGNEIA